MFIVSDTSWWGSIMGYWEPLTSNQEDGNLNAKKDANLPPFFVLLWGDCPLATVDGFSATYLTISESNHFS